MPRVLVLSHTTGYQLRAFNDAAERLGIELVFATDRCRKLDDPWQDRAVAVRFHDPDASVAAIVARAEREPIAGVIAVGDRPVILAARAAAALGIPWHSVAAAIASTDKRRSRALIAAAGLPSPRFTVLGLGDQGSGIGFPCIVKPLGLSGSRGVIRADDAREFDAAVVRIRALLARPQVRAARSGLEDEILVEEYIPGREYALEGVLTAGALRVFAIFDKPDPLEGPFFEETLYVTPSRLPAAAQGLIVEHVQRASAALGLSHGPIHAECRVTPDGTIYVLEIAARPIGGLCAKALRFENGPFEEFLLRHALGENVSGWQRESQASAVMMIPIPRSGVYRGVSGVEQAVAVEGVDEVQITAKPDQQLLALPEGASYLGFIFARAASPAEAERAVREAHARLQFRIDPLIEVRSER